MIQKEFANRATHGFAWNHLYKSFDYGLYNLFVILVARTLGSHSAAPFFVYFSLATPIALIGTLGVDGVLLRFVALVQKNEREHDPHDLITLPLPSFLARFFSFRMFIATVLFLLILFVFIALPHLVPSLAVSFGSLTTLAPYLGIFIIGQAITSFTSFALVGLLRVRSVFFASLISRSLLLVSAGCLIFGNALSAETAIIAHTASVMLNGMLLLYWLWRGLHEPSTEKVARPVKSPFRSIARQYSSFFVRPSSVRFLLLTPVMLYGITTWGSDLLSSILGRAPDILMIRMILGEHSVQISSYVAATTILLTAEYVALFGLSGALVSVFSSLAHEDQRTSTGGSVSYTRLSHARKEVAAFQTVVTIPICAFVFLFARQIILVIWGKEFALAIPILQCGVVILAFNMAIVGAGVHITSLVTIGKERLVFRYRLLWGAINIVANYFLITFFGGIGALFGTQISNAAACATEGYFAKRYIGSCFDARNSAMVVGISLGSAAIGYLLILTVLGIEEPLAQLICGGAVTATTCLACYYIFKLPAAYSLLVRFRRVFLPDRDQEVETL